MRLADLLQEIRKMRFEDAYAGSQERWLTQEEAARLLGRISGHPARISIATMRTTRTGWSTSASARFRIGNCRSTSSPGWRRYTASNLATIDAWLFAEPFTVQRAQQLNEHLDKVEQAQAFVIAYVPGLGWDINRSIRT